MIFVRCCSASHRDLLRAPDASHGCAMSAACDAQVDRLSRPSRCPCGRHPQHRACGRSTHLAPRNMFAPMPAPSRPHPASWVDRRSMPASAPPSAGEVDHLPSTDLAHQDLRTRFALISVDFPAQLSPMMASTSPVKFRSRPSSRRRGRSSSPYPLRRSRCSERPRDVVLGASCHARPF